MRVLVPIKRVIDYAVKVRVLPDKSGVDLNNVKMSLNPFCEIAIEEAVRLKEKKIATELVAVSIGPKASQDSIRTALAMGIDKGIHIETNLRTDQELQPLAVAKILKEVAKKEDAKLVVLGKQSIDSDNGQVGQMLAALLNWPQVTFASKLTFSDDKQSLTVDRETDKGSEVVQVSVPAVVTADLRLNEPRYASLPNIMKAKKKPIESIPADKLIDAKDLQPRIIVVKVEEPAARKAGEIVDSVDALINSLKNKAKVI
jgi:electron transfer flavoprotein beta subunit